MWPSALAAIRSLSIFCLPPFIQPICFLFLPGEVLMLQVWPDIDNHIWENRSKTPCLSTIYRLLIQITNFLSRGVIFFDPVCCMYDKRWQYRVCRREYLFQFKSNRHEKIPPSFFHSILCTVFDTYRTGCFGPN